jgi:hypothetical protein
MVPSFQAELPDLVEMMAERVALTVLSTPVEFQASEAE